MDDRAVGQTELGSCGPNLPGLTLDTMMRASHSYYSRPVQLPSCRKTQILE